LSLQDSGMIREILDHWPTNRITTIVITDGERILGLGDLGVNGMGIPIGKLALYTACGGIPPDQVLPVHLDVGTDNQENWKDPYYLGLKQARERGHSYDALIKEFVEAAQQKFGRNVLIQFEDFGNTNAFRLLRQYQNIACAFNDDIQGTAAVVVAGLMSANKITGMKMVDHTFLFSGAGEAGTGIADLIAFAISFESQLPVDEAHRKIFLVDSMGLVTKSRQGLQDHKINYAHNVEMECPDLLSALDYLQPTVLIGVSTKPKTFNQKICEKMAAWNDRPIIFALSNPTSKAECTAEEAYTWTDGRCIFSSGSPFPNVTLMDGRTFIPSQGNTAFIFPGVGLAALIAGMSKITDHDMLLAAETLTKFVTSAHIAMGCLYPPLSEIRMVSATIAGVIALHAYETGMATKPRPKDMMAAVRAAMYDPFDMESN
jgi:malate dehydrogenase (oxaloacetate-decarboxylating)(NADP+)